MSIAELISAYSIAATLIVLSIVVVSLSTKYPKSDGAKNGGVKITSAGFFLVLVFSIALIGLPIVTGTDQPTPKQILTIQGRQFEWKLSRSNVTMDVPVQIITSSNDVNHALGIYGPDGSLFSQINSLPGQEVSTILTFPKDGDYTIRCLQYCGIGHDTMIATLKVIR